MVSPCLIKRDLLKQKLLVRLQACSPCLIIAAGPDTNGQCAISILIRTRPGFRELLSNLVFNQLNQAAT